MNRFETSPVLRLGLIDLQPEDAILIRTLLTLKPQGSSLPWALGDSAPYDAMIVDTANRKGGETALALEQRECPVLVLGGAQLPDNPNQLQRPIRAANLYAWLDTVPLLNKEQLLPPSAASFPKGDEQNLDLVIPAAELQGNTQDPSPMEKDKIITTRPGMLTPVDFVLPPAAASQAAAEPDRAAAMLQPVSLPPAPPNAPLNAPLAPLGSLSQPLDFDLTAPLAMKAPLPMGVAPAAPISMPSMPTMPLRMPTAATAPAESVATKATNEYTNTAEVTISANMRYKLLRWPPAELMGNDRERIRLASLLSRQALRLDELEAISQIEPQACLRFMQELMVQSLLDERKDLSNPAPASAPQTPAESTTTATPEAPTTTPAPEKKSRWGLIKAIREHLGL